MRFALCVLAVFAGGCFLDRAGLRGPDGPGDGAVLTDANVDAPLRDAAPDAELAEAGVDADRPAVDAGMDAAPPPLDAAPDAEPPDAGRDAATDAFVPPPFCDSSDPTLRLCIQCEGSAADASGRGQAVSASATFAAGAVGQGCEVGPGTSFVVGDADSLDPGEITIELFARVDTVPTSGRSGLADKDGAWGLFVYPDGDVRCTGSGPALFARGAIVAGAWTHIACAWGTAGGRLYIDGTLAESGGGGVLAATGATLNIAEDSDDGDDQLQGAIDELRIFAEARTDAQIRASAAR